MKYEEISEYIINNIKKGTYRPGSKVPSETDLIGMFNTSRMTVRKGIETAVSMGYVYSIKGKGTFVVDDTNKFEIDLNDLSGFTQRTLKWGMEPRSDVRALLKKKPNDVISQKFGNALDEIVYIEIVRYVNDYPMAVEYDYIDPRYIGKINLADITNSLSTFIQSKDIKIKRIKKEFKAVIPHYKIADLLKITSNIPVVRIDYNRYLEDDTLLEYAKVFYNQNLFKFVQIIDS